MKCPGLIYAYLHRSLALAAVLAALVIAIAPSDAAWHAPSPEQEKILIQARKTWLRGHLEHRLDR